MADSPLRSSLESRLPRYLEELAALVAIDSPSSHRAGTEEVARWFGARYRALGAEVSFEPGAPGPPSGTGPPAESALSPQPGGWGDHLLARFRGKGGGRVLLLGHTDTVFPVGEAARRPFRAEGGRAYGPGVADMKGCLLAALYALEGLFASGFDSFGEILLLYDSDEEVGNPSSRPLIERLAPSYDASLILESARADGSLVSARKGSSLFRMEVEGVAAHSGVEPEKGRSAVLELAHKIVAAHSIARPGRDGTVNVTGLSGGERPFIVPPDAAATVELRAFSARELGQMERELRALGEVSFVEGTRTRLLPLGGRPVMERSAGTARLVALAQEIAREGGFEIRETATGGGSDGNFTSALGVPTLDGLGPVGGNLHREDEYLEIASLPERAWLLGEMVRRVGERGPKSDLRAGEFGVA